jgi:hypothetical protein
VAFVILMKTKNIMNYTLLILIVLGYAISKVKIFAKFGKRKWVFSVKNDTLIYNDMLIKRFSIKNSSQTSNTLILKRPSISKNDSLLAKYSNAKVINDVDHNFIKTIIELFTGYTYDVSNKNKNYYYVTVTEQGVIDKFNKLISNNSKKVYQITDSSATLTMKQKKTKKHP